MSGARRGREAGRELAVLARKVRLVARATPLNFAREVARVGAAWSEGRVEEPRFSYAPPSGLVELRQAIAQAAAACEGPLAELYSARAEELCVELGACEVVGTPAFRERLRDRFPHRDRFDEEADQLAERWASIEPAGEGGETIATDDEHDARSLLSAMRRAVGEHRLPVRVKASPGMAPLAATGDGVIYVAAGRRLSAEDAARTVLHEVLGHALPWAMAKRAEEPIFDLGTAFGADDQEGRALAIEEQAGALSAGRRRELALRHVSARGLAAGATFVDTVRALLRHDASVEDAVRIGARVHRGGGLGREVAYVPGLLRVRTALSADPGLDALLGRGRVSVEAARVMAALGEWESEAE
ncbi:MAG: DUF1704 domain-containing protein [Polyangiaceae bacterium]